MTNQWRNIADVRLLQIRELVRKYPNDQELGASVRELIKKTPEDANRILNK